jgi:hypothetical protein
MKYNIKKLAVLLALSLFAVGAFAKATAAIYGVLAPDEAHYYETHLEAGSWYLGLEGVDLEDCEGAGDLDIYIMDEDNNILAMDIELDNMPYVEFDLEEDTVVWIIVHNAGDGCTYYESVEYRMVAR